MLTQIKKAIQIILLDMKLRNKLALFYSLVSIVPVIIVGLVSYTISEHALINEVTVLLKSDVEKSSERINATLKSWLDKSSIIAESETITAGMPYDYDNDYPVAFDFYKELNTLLTSVLAADGVTKNKTQSRIELYTFNDSILKDYYFIKDASEFHLDGINKGELTKDVLEKYPRNFWLPLQKQEDGIEVVTYCKKLFTNGYREVSGIMCIYINVSSLKDELSTIQLPKGGWAVYLDAYGNRIFTINAPDKDTEYLENILTSKENQIDADENLYFIRSTPSNGGKLILSYPKVYLGNKVFGIIGITPLFVLLSIAGAIIVSYLVAMLITKRLTRFIDNIMHMSDYERPIIAPLAGNDEIGMLYREFNTMVDRVNMLMQDKYQASINKRALELELLQYQVNPHFLYNVLASIKWIGKGVIGEIVDCIVKFFRMSLNNGREVISITTEIEIIKEYIKIQQFTFDDRFEVVFDIDEDVSEWYTIKLILQPIVENAILHGINGKKDFTGRIRIVGNRIGNDISLIVEDNGAGMDEESLLRLSEENSSRKINKGYGIRNVKERLKLIYGEKYGISIESKPGVGTKVTLLIPCCSEDGLLKKLERFI